MKESARSEALLLDAWQQIRDAMLLRDTAALKELLAETFTLTHMTGYVQSKTEWLDAIEEDEMQYHDIRDVERAISRDGDGVVLTVRTMTDATIWGGHSTWRLQLQLRFPANSSRMLGDTATVEDMVATVW